MMSHEVFSAAPARGAVTLRPNPLTEEPALLRLQRTHGNRFVQRMVARAQRGDDITSVPETAAAAINAKRGGGGALDEKTRSAMEGGFSADFSQVRVHDDGASHALNRTLNAKAFTAGQDIFFGEGQFRPGSQEGTRLIAHELTHTLQQKADDQVKPGDAVSQPHEPAEKEAERVADHVTSTREHPEAV